VKLYRLIPDSVVSICETGYICDISEDLFYKLGYISKNDHMNSYFLIRNQGDSWAKNIENGIFFFFSPWDCLSNLIHLNDCYGSEIARIFEYEVDDVMVNNSPQGYGYYNQVAYREVKIPLNILTKGAISNTEITPELKDKLTDISLCNAEETFKYLKESVVTNEYSKLKHSKESILNDSLRENYFNSGRAEKINARRLTNCGNFFKSDIITGKSLVITAAQRTLLFDFLDDPEKYIQQIYKLCESSNGIFTIENLMDFNNQHGFSVLDIASQKK